MVNIFFVSAVKSHEEYKNTIRIKVDYGAQAYFGRAPQLEIFLWVVFLVERIWGELVRFFNNNLSSSRACREISTLASNSPPGKLFRGIIKTLVVVENSHIKDSKTNVSH